jgi:hypothetical protein
MTRALISIAASALTGVGERRWRAIVAGMVIAMLRQPTRQNKPAS